MAKHLNPLEKEFLIRTYRSNQAVKINDFCEKNSVSVGAFKKWLKQYEEGGLEGLARADTEIRSTCCGLADIRSCMYVTVEMLTSCLH